MLQDKQGVKTVNLAYHSSKSDEQELEQNMIEEAVFNSTADEEMVKSVDIVTIRRSLQDIEKQMR